ncbi:Crp/Fnr family transcriptional regulator [Thermodesulfobacteriota bacterium]
MENNKTKLLKNLKQNTLFSALSDDELEKVLNIVKVKKMKKGTLIFSQDEPAEGFYAVTSGRVKIYKLANNGKQHILHIVTTEGVFAEAAVFSGITYPAYAETLSDCELLYFPKDEFYDLIKNNPKISLSMLATLSKYLRRFSNKIEELSLKDVSARLAKYILNQSSDFMGKSFELKIKKSELASQLGTVSETLSRSFSKLKAAKAIDVKGKYIYILDSDKLIDISEA